MQTTYSCDISALSAEQRLRHSQLARLLRADVVAFEELSNGYSAKFRSIKESELVDFSELEVKCCPFFNITVSKHQGFGVLTVTGDGEIKPFIRAEFGIPSKQNHGV